MRRLDILLIGHSPALIALGRELSEHGHQLLHLATQAQLAGALPRADVLIEDASLTLNQHPTLRCVHLGLRISLTPALEWLCWAGSARAQRLIIRQAVAADPGGNGQGLRQAAIADLVARMALEISRYSRNPEHFAQAQSCDAAALERQQGLLALEPLAYQHRLNDNANEGLLHEARQPIGERLEHSLQQHARRTALQLQHHSLSYGQLHRMALQVRQTLPDSARMIAVCLPKSAELYAALLAVISHGAVYLPLDPSHPPERLRAILENAGAQVLLHSGPTAFEVDGLQCVDLTQLPEAAKGSLFDRQPGPDEPCVAIYTSGTTGQPKGVLLSQANLSHFQAWYTAHVQLTEHSRVLQFSTIGFDASLLDIIPTLIVGATLVVPGEDQRRDPHRLVELIGQQRVSHAFLPPALLSILPQEAPLGLAHLITGGDVCEPAVIEHFARHCQMHNIYGPTETTVLATTRLLTPTANNRDLGRPIANTQLLILDDDLQPVPDDTPGELYIVGAGVGPGYLNNPTLTAERYLTLQLPGAGSLRAYRTGDIGKWMANGIEICGRRDNQVKIRGFRVEPEEIEHCLRSSQLFAQVAVAIDSQRHILAFVAQPRDGQPGEALNALRRQVEQQLPDYMRPQQFTELAQLPATANGKVDRRALLQLPRSLPARAAHRPAQTPQELQLLAIWSQLLDLPAAEISTDESFFNLGGHSILLSQLLLAIREQFGRGISINRFIEQPTLQRLAALVSGIEGDPQTLSPQAFVDAYRELDLQPLPLSQLGDVHKVVVTGANSFLGVHIVEALLAWGASEVACLVRDSAESPAAERFAQALRDNRLEHLDMSRVHVYAADITQPRLGLSEAVYARIDQEYGALVHNAAHVNHVLDYEALAADNVEPLFECLKLCEGRSKKIFNFISTLSASSAIDASGSVLEQPPADTPPIYIRNGYNLSKWVAERILQRAREQGAWVNLYRPGNITFNSLTGVCQPHKNRLMLMLKGSLQLGQVPALSLNFDLMPVDFLARFIAFHSSRYQAEHAVFNLHNPEPLSWESYVASFRAAGREFELVSVGQWQQQLNRVGHDNALFGVLGFYLDGFEEDIGDISRIDHHNALAGVLRMGERYPRKTPALLSKGCAYLREIQFI
ncbi:non-ribosomal peptide synthetase [Pseudomonas abieticivorans]|uniref:non-ribosomal peptide synthetase n=1 Tax=Pseudomonas abieticivorans TaxID=2931382 RepID=UPI0020C14BE5|nr:non-ribosomal peptide synthetase [Pseudomonas sp. PIA16]